MELLEFALLTGLRNSAIGVCACEVDAQLVDRRADFLVAGIWGSAQYKVGMSRPRGSTQKCSGYRNGLKFEWPASKM